MYMMAGLKRRFWTSRGDVKWHLKEKGIFRDGWEVNVVYEYGRGSLLERRFGREEKGMYDYLQSTEAA